jgi:hypothetical protein
MPFCWQVALAFDIESDFISTRNMKHQLVRLNNTSHNCVRDVSQFRLHLCRQVFETASIE